MNGTSVLTQETPQSSLDSHPERTRTTDQADAPRTRPCLPARRRPACQPGTNPLFLSAPAYRPRCSSRADEDGPLPSPRQLPEALPGLPGGSAVKSPPAVREARVRSLGRDDALENRMATCSGILDLENPTNRGACWAAVHAVAGLDTTERLTLSVS